MWSAPEYARETFELCKLALGETDGWMGSEFGRRSPFAVEIRTCNPSGLALIGSAFDFRASLFLPSSICGTCYTYLLRNYITIDKKHTYTSQLRKHCYKHDLTRFFAASVK